MTRKKRPEAKLKVSTTVKGKTQRKIQQRENDKRPEAKERTKGARDKGCGISDPGRETRTRDEKPSYVSLKWSLVRVAGKSTSETW